LGTATTALDGFRFLPDYTRESTRAIDPLRATTREADCATGMWLGLKTFSRRHVGQAHALRRAPTSAIRPRATLPLNPIWKIERHAR
jgi:hypothetical protein